jgi:hypothetical protein
MEHDDIYDLPDPEAQERAGHDAHIRRPPRDCTAGAPEQPQAYHRDEVHEDVEHTVRKDLHPKIPERLTFNQAQQVMPLQHLVEQDAINESAESDAKDPGCQVQASSAMCFNSDIRHELRPVRKAARKMVTQLKSGQLV